MSTCASRSRAAAEPLAGTAATATTWLLVEQPGPWGAEALTGSRLPPSLGQELAAAAEGSGVRLGLIRRPAPPGDRAGRAGAPERRRVYVAHTVPGRSWVRSASVADPWALRAWDFAALGAGDPRGAPGEAYAGAPLVLVCANGRRDRCCALLGRPLAAEAAASGVANVWETTHLGGHRFAPTLLLLPHGYAYGRATPVTVKAAADALQEGRVLTDHCRGRSCWERPGQAAELAVRRLTGEAAADALRVTESAAAGGSPPARWDVTVGHADGRRWRVAVAEDADAPAVPASCGAEPRPQPRLTVADVRALASAA